MTVSLNGTTGLTFPDSSTQATAATGFGFKNRIINGAMMIDQRNAGASVTATGNPYTLDRWQAVSTQSAKYTVQQNAGSVTPPAGFVNYLGVTSSSAYSVLSTDLFILKHAIEGVNVADLGFGTASASTVTISFWVRSSLTGTFGGSIKNAAATLSYPFTFTISVANTWEQKTVTIAGSTSGTWLTNTSVGIELNINLGAGSTYSATASSWQAGNFVAPTGATSVVGTSGATFYITGVQLEKGSTATSFDYRPYGTELSLCQRYGEPLYCNPEGAELRSYAVGSGYFASYWQYKVEKRAAATITKPSGGTWSVATPIIYGGISTVEFITNAGQFTLVGASGAQVLFASAEL